MRANIISSDNTIYTGREKMDDLSIVLIGIGSAILVAIAAEVLSLKPKSLVRRTPAVIKSIQLIVAFVNLILLLSVILSSLVVPFFVANPGILSVLALLGITLLVGFGLSSLLTIKTLYERIVQFIHMTQNLGNPSLEC